MVGCKHTVAVEMMIIRREKTKGYEPYPEQYPDMVILDVQAFDNNA